MSRQPADLLYAQSHEWLDLADDGTATIGVSAFAIEQLNDLVYMDLPEVGVQVQFGEQFGEVESVKAVSPLYSPVTGEVVEVHAELPEELEQLNEDPYNFGWIVKVRVSSDEGRDQLLDHAAYEKQCSESA